MELSDNSTINITNKAFKSNHKFSVQTSYSVIKKNEVLLSLLKNNTINIDTDISTLTIILNYLRGYTVSDALINKAIDANRLGIVFEGYVMVNVGGKIFNVNRALTSEKLSYFESFYNFNEKLQPDFSSILIDRCSHIFDSILVFISDKNPKAKPVICKSVSIEQFHEDLAFYGYQSERITTFIDLDAISFINIGRDFYDVFSADNIVCTQNEMSNIYSFDLTPSTLYLFHFSDDIKNSIELEINGTKQDFYILKYNNNLSYDPIEKIFTLRYPTEASCNITLSKKILLKNVKRLEDTKKNLRSMNMSNIENKLYPIDFNGKVLSVNLNELVSKNDIKLKYRHQRADTTIFDTLKFAFRSIYIHADTTNISYVELKQNSKIICRSKIKSIILGSSSRIELMHNRNLSLEYCLLTDANCELLIYFPEVSKGKIYLEFKIEPYTEITKVTPVQVSLSSSSDEEDNVTAQKIEEINE